MNSLDFPALPLLEEGISAPEIYRRVGVFLDALGAIPKKSWRPGVDSSGIRVEGPKDITPALQEALAETRPVVLDVVTDAEHPAPEPWRPA